MSRTLFPFVAPDVSALARSLHRELEACEHTPGHVQLLNMLTRSAGYRNFQHFRAQQVARDRLEREPDPPAAQPVDHLRVGRVARHFDQAGRLLRWPPKAHQRTLCLWVLWSRLPAGRVLAEAAVNAILQGHHHFGDHALLRRGLVDEGMVTRTADGREYRRLERPPPPDAVALIRHLGRRAPG
ncbi:hypothetical protein STVA_38160 [Allostella vacuolata]|nr:hypothetical protein STVA_38160 [Stella vacuolata]